MRFILPLFFLSFFLVKNQSTAQNTVGLLSYQPNQSFDGYNLMFPHSQPNVYLLDNCGEIVHVWTDSATFRPGNIAYLRADGSLIKGKRNANVTMDRMWAGGGGSTIEVRDWDNTLLSSYTMNDSMNRFHHDFAPMPNGNFLAIAWEYKSEAEALQAGRDTATTARDELWPDWIVEINPATEEIVWEWHAFDHLIQDFDSTKSNFGVVGDHPELIDINYDTNNGHPDWMHSNSIDYNPESDQILLSVPQFDEIWVIDHTTTTSEAAGHTGGFSGRGGDLMYRWGNPKAYRAGDSTDQRLFYQHDAHWVDDFLTPNHPHYGKIALFNNRVNPMFSVANVLSQPWDMYNLNYEMVNGKFLPEDVDDTYGHPMPTDLWSTGLSSMQFLPNGNTLICAGRFGYSFELTPNNDIVWEYKTPLRGGQPASQGDTLTINQNLTFRIKRYPTTYTAFTGRDLSSKGWIEVDPDSTFCSDIVPTFQLVDDAKYRIFPNPASNQITIEWDGMQYGKLEVFNARGIRVASYMGNGGRTYLDTSEWGNGLYIVRIDGMYSRKLLIQR